MELPSSSEIKQGTLMLLNSGSGEEIGRLPSIVRCPLADIKAQHEAVVLTTEPAWEAVKDIDINPSELVYVEGNTEVSYGCTRRNV